MAPAACLASTAASQDPAYLACLAGTWVGNTADGKACSLVWNGADKVAEYTVGADKYSIDPAQFQYSIYIYDSQYRILSASVTWYQTNLAWTLNPSGNAIEFVKRGNPDVTSSCRLTGRT